MILPCILVTRQRHILTWRLKAEMVELEKTAIVEQRLVETRFRSNKYAGINQSFPQGLTPFARQRLPKMRSHINRGFGGYVESWDEQAFPPQWISRITEEP
jgi:hypothetical protein